MQTTIDDHLFEKVKILIVDDEQRNLATMKQLLEPLGETIVTASSGKEALRQILQHNFAVVLLDVKMPEISGLEVAQLMRQRPATRETPIIFITGYQENSLEVQKGYEMGAVDYLVKPIEPRILLTKVRVFVKLHRKTIALEHQKEIAFAELKKNKLLLRSNYNLSKLKQEAEQFAYIASHDLQTPLRHIGTYIDLLKDSLGEEISEEQAEAIDVIGTSTRRMKRLIKDLLELSRIGRQALNLNAEDLNDVLEEVIDSMRDDIEEAGASVRVGALPRIAVDRVKMRQVFQNIIANALKYCPKDRTPEIEVEASLSADLVEFSVKDNGIGIEPDHYERIFEIFQRLHPENSYSGTGIGLAICKKIVELHDGNIWVDSEPGTGSTFYFSIPAQMEELRDEPFSTAHPLS